MSRWTALFFSVIPASRTRQIDKTFIKGQDQEHFKTHNKRKLCQRYRKSRFSGDKTAPLAAVYKSGTGTRGRGHGDACVGTWDLGTRDEGLGDVKYGTQGRQKLGRREPGMLMIIAKVGGKCDISFFVKMCYLWSTLDSIFQNHIGHLMMFTQNISL